MAIITLAEFKAYTTLYNSSTMSDAEISALIPIVEQDYITIQGRRFLTVTGDTTDSDATVSDIDTTFIVVNQTLNGDSVRGVVTSIDADNEEVELDATATATSDDETLTVYPVGSTYTAARMIKYQFDTANIDYNVQSESLEKHSVTYKSGTSAQLLNGYPIALVGNIRGSFAMNTGTVTGEGYYKGRQEVEDYCNGLVENNVNFNARNSEGS